MGILASGSQLFEITELFGRGSWIRTNDLQYPKLIFVDSRSFLLMPDDGKPLQLKAILVPRESSAKLRVLPRWRLGGDLDGLNEDQDR